MHNEEILSIAEEILDFIAEKTNIRYDHDGDGVISCIEKDYTVYDIASIIRQRVKTVDPEMLSALELAMHALNTAPRFKVPSLDTKDERMDSYKIASTVSAVIKKAKGE